MGGIVGGLVGLGTSIFGGVNASNASAQAAQQIVAADQQAEGQMQANLSTVQGYYSPYTSAGSAALGQYGNLVGANGAGAQSAAIAALKSSPQYQALFNNGQNTILANAAATGGLRSGNVQDSLSAFGANTLASVLQNQESQLAGLSNMGLGATESLGQNTTATNSAIAQLMSGIGQAQASGTMGSAAAMNSMAGGIANALGGGIGGGSSGIMNALFGGSAGSGLTGAGGVGTVMLGTTPYQAPLINSGVNMGVFG